MERENFQSDQISSICSAEWLNMERKARSERLDMERKVRQAVARQGDLRGCGLPCEQRRRAQDGHSKGGSQHVQQRCWRPGPGPEEGRSLWPTWVLVSSLSHVIWLCAAGRAFRCQRARAHASAGASTDSSSPPTFLVLHGQAARRPRARPCPRRWSSGAPFLCIRRAGRCLNQSCTGLYGPSAVRICRPLGPPGRGQRTESAGAGQRPTSVSRGGSQCRSVVHGPAIR